MSSLPMCTSIDSILCKIAVLQEASSASYLRSPHASPGLVHTNYSFATWHLRYASLPPPCLCDACNLCLLQALHSVSAHLLWVCLAFGARLNAHTRPYLTCWLAVKSISEKGQTFGCGCYMFVINLEVSHILLITRGVFRRSLE